MESLFCLFIFHKVSLGKNIKAPWISDKKCSRKIPGAPIG